MMKILSALSTFSLLICFASANAFSNAFQQTGFYKSMTLTMSALTTPSKYNSREAEIFSKDIQQVIAMGPIPIDERQFLINGWRWHTASALRDLERYCVVIGKIEANEDKIQDISIENTSREAIKNRVVSCYNYVCDYNLKALIKIESELFFPWLQRLLPDTAMPLMSEIVQEQADVKVLSNQIGYLCKSLSGDSGDICLIRKIGLKVREIQKSYLKIQSVQETIFVPYITAFISRKEQERFNRGVISNLGFIRAQVHLCGMIEAIKDQPTEMSLLRSQIPSIAQATLPVWKKRIYDPKTACLEFPSV